VIDLDEVEARVRRACAPWLPEDTAPVTLAIIAELRTVRAELEVAKAFHDVAVKERDAARVSATEWRERAEAADKGYGQSFEERAEAAETALALFRGGR
jgi:hypothetical protein